MRMKEEYGTHDAENGRACVRTRVPIVLAPGVMQPRRRPGQDRKRAFERGCEQTCDAELAGGSVALGCHVRVEKKKWKSDVLGSLRENPHGEGHRAGASR
jgi:hypothetical protein